MFYVSMYKKRKKFSIGTSSINLIKNDDKITDNKCLAI